MISKFEALPFGVKVASVYLIALYLLVCLILPTFGVPLTICMGTFAAVLRIVRYFERGE